MLKEVIEMKIVAFMQNAWSSGVYAGGTWPRDSWLSALSRSKSGKRLRILAKDIEIWWDNTTPLVGDSPNSILPPDIPHMNLVLKNQQPEMVVALGKQAFLACRGLRKQSPLLILPHPTYRVMTNEVYTKGNILLKQGFKGTIEIKQRRGWVEILTGERRLLK